MKKWYGRALATGTALALVPLQAMAQETAAPQEQEGDADTASDIDTIVVTGTSIKGVAAVGSPTVSVNDQDLAATGFGNTNDMLKTLPQFVGLGMGEGRGGNTQSAVANITQAQTINLRGLGPDSTLVLLDGHRIAPSGTQGQFYDVSVFPSNALQRVEVVADGASAIYGSEAVGGVVNFITKRNFTGGESRARYAFGDGYEGFTLSQNLGYAWGSGDIFVAYEHYYRSNLFGGERARATQDLRPYGGPDLRTDFGNPGTIVVDGIRYAVPAGQNGVGLTASALIPGTTNPYDLYDTRSLLPEQNRDGIFASVRQDISPTLRVWASGYYSDRDINGYGISQNSGASTATLTVPRSNPFFVHPTDPAAATVSVNYSFANDFLAVATGGEEGYHAAAGVTWDAFSDWTIDVYGSLNQNIAQRRVDGLVRTAPLNAALADPDPATAFNPFCDGTAFTCNNPATLAKINGYSLIKAKVRVKDIVAKADGTLFALPGGPVRMAIGTEFTKSEGFFGNTRNTSSTADIVPLIYNPRVNRTVKAAFGELYIPVVGADNATSGIRRLDLSVAGRIEDYSDFGSTFNPKFGFRYDPVEGVSLRGSYGTSFHAPTLFAIDPTPTTGPNATNLVDPKTGTSVRAIQIQGPAPNLGPETATTWSLGLDVRPLSLPGFRFSATYYNIDYEDRLGALSTSLILANESLFPDRVTRNPSEAFVLSLMSNPNYTSPPEPPSNIKLVVDQRAGNLGGTKQTGLDLSAGYDFATDIGQFSIGADANLTLTAKQSDAPGFAYVDRLDLINFPIATRGRARLGWQRGGLRFDGFLNYTGDYENDLVTPSQKVDDYASIDATISYTIEDDRAGPLKGLQLSISAINLLNTQPPVVIDTQTGAQGAFDPNYGNILGREIAINIRKTW